MDIYYELKRTAKQTIVYALGNASTKLAGLILVPLYTKYLTVSEYGILGLIELVLQFTIVFGGLGLAPALIRWHSLATSEEEKKKLLFTTTTATIAVGVILLVISMLISGNLAESFFGSSYSTQSAGEFLLYLRLTVLTAILELLLLIPFSLLRVEERAFLFSILWIARFTVVVILSVILVAFYNLGIEGVLLSFLLSALLSFIMMLPYLYKNSRLGLLSGELKGMLRYGIPIMASSVAIIVLNLGDRYLLKILSTLDSVGLYTLGYRIAGVVNFLFVSSFALGFYPAIFKFTDDAKAKLFLSKTLTYFTLVLFWTILALSLFAGEILQFIVTDPVYWGAEKVVFLLSMGFGFYGMFFIVSIVFYLQKRPGTISALVAGTVVLNIALNFLLIPRLDIVGAGFATVISYASMLLATIHFAKKIYPVRYSWMRILSVVALTTAFYGTSFLWRSSAMWANVALDLLLTGSFPVVLYFTGFFEAEDLERLQAWLRRLFSSFTK